MNNKLTEFKDIAQNEKDVFRRVFVDGDNDLTVWYDIKRVIIGFELTIDNVVLTHAENKFSIRGIDRSEKDNFTPILSGTAEVDLNHVITYIDTHGIAIDRSIIDYIKTILAKKL